MTDADPTIALMQALNRADPHDWGRIIYGMPIFVEHDGYEVDGGKGQKSLVVVPKGEQPPANGKKIYTVDRNRLESIAAEINREYQSSGTPIKLFIGHSDPKKPQVDNPPIAGYGRGAYLGQFGPQNRLAIKTDAFYKPGYENAAADYPERSPEFVPRTNGITGVALLKTDPRLKMGMVAYESDELSIVYYGVGFIAETIQYGETAMPAPGNTDDVDDTSEKEADDASAPAQGAAAAASVPTELPPLQDHEIKFYNRFVRHMEENHPAIKYLCGEHKKYMDTQAAMATPAQNPAVPSAANGEPQKKPERLDMSEQERIDYAETKQRLHALEVENARLYATDAIDTLEREGILFKDKPKEINRLVQMRTEQNLPLEKIQEHLAEIRLNYARVERSPAQLKGWLPIVDGHPEGATGQEVVEEPEAADMLRYAQEHNIDLDTEAGVAQVVAALTKKQEKSAAA